jgi:ethanolamine-phosphate cytidylyltransferase
MLLVTKSHHEPDDRLPDAENKRRMSLCKESVSPWTGASQFLATTNKIIQFSNGREPKVGKIFSEKFIFIFIIL